MTTVTKTTDKIIAERHIKMAGTDWAEYRVIDGVNVSASTSRIESQENYVIYPERGHVAIVKFDSDSDSTYAEVATICSGLASVGSISIRVVADDYSDHGFCGICYAAHYKGKDKHWHTAHGAYVYGYTDVLAEATADMGLDPEVDWRIFCEIDEHSNSVQYIADSEEVPLRRKYLCLKNYTPEFVGVTDAVKKFADDLANEE